MYTNFMWQMRYLHTNLLYTPLILKKHKSNNRKYFFISLKFYFCYPFKNKAFN